MAKNGGEKQPDGVKFILGSLSGVAATCIAQPLDLIKTRMQLIPSKQYRTTLSCFQSVIAREGLTGLYGGLGASLTRHIVHSATRLCVYAGLYEEYRLTSKGEPPFTVRALMFLIAGVCGTVITAPAELVYVRMAANAALPIGSQHNYKNLGTALLRVVKEEGFIVLFSGCWPSVGRILVANTAQLASYSRMRAFFQKRYHVKQGAKLHFLASMCSSILMAGVSMPLDVAATRLQSMKTIDGKPEYRGTVDAIGKVMRSQGILGLWKGLTPCFLRHGIHTVVMFILWERLNRLYIKLQDTKKKSISG